MKTNPVIRWLCLLMVCTLTACASQNVTPSSTENINVTYADDAWRDDMRGAAPKTEQSLLALQDALGRHLATQVAARLPADQRVAIRITLVERAGGFEPWRGPQAADVRIVRDIYPPRIDLTFRQTDGSGHIVKEGQRMLRDPAFMMQTDRYPKDRLRHEKTLLDEWARKEFGAAK